MYDALLDDLEDDATTRTEEDSIEDFRDVYKFADAFGAAYSFEVKE